MVPTFRCFVVRGLTLRKEAGGRETDPGMPPCVWSWPGTEQFQVRVFEMDDQETGNNDVGRNPGIGGRACHWQLPMLTRFERIDS